MDVARSIDIHQLEQMVDNVGFRGVLYALARIADSKGDRASDQRVSQKLWRIASRLGSVAGQLSYDPTLR